MWSTFPPKTGTNPPTPAQKFAAQANVCLQATSRAEEIVNQPLRATQTTEVLSGPDSRCTVQWSSGNGRLLAARWPVVQVLSVSVSNNSTWPRQFVPLAAGNFEPEFPVDGLFGAAVPSAGAGGQSILFSPGNVVWPQGWPGGQLYGRQGFRVNFTYISGFPHTSLTAAAASGATTVAVDDCTGWILTGISGTTIGATGIIYDALGGGQEPVVCTAATAATGPGTLTLAAGLQYAHQPGIVVSAMPQSIIWATALLAGQAALIRGATATTVQTTGGRQQGGLSPLEQDARNLLNTFRRTV